MQIPAKETIVVNRKKGKIHKGGDLRYAFWGKIACNKLFLQIEEMKVQCVLLIMHFSDPI
jgi:hypothetical protein